MCAWYQFCQGRYTFYNDTHQLPLNEDTPTMRNALHGLLAGVAMQVDALTVTDTNAQVVLTHRFDGSDPGYPFVLSLSVTYTLSSNGFWIGISIHNMMPHTPLPVYVGWHPYFKCTAYSAVVKLDQCVEWNHVELNANMNPTGITDKFYGLDGHEPIGGNLTNPTFYDDEYKPCEEPSCDCEEGTLSTKICDIASGHNIVLWQDRSFRFVHVFTGYSSPDQETAIAIEPMSGMADAYNNHDHLTVLSGGETWNGRFGVYVE